jgi:AraC family transcriptional regulator of adaptative response/methylated-DNA-[protein]-cysteine methyltransferase
MNSNQQWQAVIAKDARFDGQFVFAVTSTGVYCRPSCPSRRAHRERVKFFDLPEAAEQAGFRACLRCEPQRARVLDPQIDLVQRVCRLLNSSDGETLGLAELASQTGMSVFHLQRTFKRVMGISPKQYLAARKFGNFKELVRKGESVTNSLYESGFNSSSRLYEHAAEELGMTPATYSRGGRGVNINYTLVDSSLGRLLVAVTERGVCAVRLADSDAELEKDLRAEFPEAEITRDDAGLREPVQKILNHIDHNEPHLDLPLDIRATAFQRQVWEKLRAIPYGQTVSYGSRQSFGQAGRGARGRTRVCNQSGGTRDSVSSRGARRPQFRRLSLGFGAEKEIAGARKRAALFVGQFRVRGSGGQSA